MAFPNLRPVLAAFVCLATPALAQKPGAPAQPPVVLGTKQLPGEFGKFGQTYTIGKADPINFTLTSAAYAVDRFHIDEVGDGKTAWFPNAGEKLLLVRFTMQNPVPRDNPLRSGTIKFTAVDANGENHEFGEAFLVGTAKHAEMDLKPGQKVDCFILLRVPGTGETPKLIVQREEGAAVIRYDLRGKVAKLPAWCAGADGFEGLDTIAGIRDCFHPTREFDLGVRGLEYTKADLGGGVPEEGKKFLVAHLSFRSAGVGGRLTYSTFMSVLKTEDGGEIVREAPGGTGGFMLEKSTDPIDMTPDKGDVVNVRVFFIVPENVKPATLTIKDPASNRAYRFKVGDDWFTIRDCVRDVEHVPVTLPPPPKPQ